jgi:hypothetical protein
VLGSALVSSGHGRVCPWLSRAGRQVKRPASVKIGCSPRYVVVSGCNYVPLAHGAKSSKVKGGPPFGRSPRCAMRRVPEPPIRAAFIHAKEAPCRSLTSCCASRSLSIPRCGFRTGCIAAAGKTRARRATSSTNVPTTPRLGPREWCFLPCHFSVPPLPGLAWKVPNADRTDSKPTSTDLIPDACHRRGAATALDPTGL